MNTLLEAPCARAVHSPTRSQTNPPSHILVVDDDGDIRQLSAGALVRFGYRVDLAEDGAAAWKALQANSYDLLITDNKMPKLSGVELVKKLRSVGMTLPVVLASSAIPTEELERNPWLQLAATLEKPFSRGQLLETVREVLLAADDAISGAAAFFPVPTGGDLAQITPAMQWGDHATSDDMNERTMQMEVRAVAKTTTSSGASRAGAAARIESLGLMRILASQDTSLTMR